MEKIPILYRAILERIYQISFNGRVEVGKAREIIRTKFRVPQSAVMDLWLEMKEMGLIEFENQKFMQINCSIIKKRRFFG